MSDQCRNCVVQGDLAKCLAMNCYQHENWFNKTMIEKNIQLSTFLAAARDENTKLEADLEAAQKEIEDLKKELDISNTCCRELRSCM